MSGPFADFSDGDDDHHSRACQCGQSVGWWCVEGRSVLARQQQYIKRTRRRRHGRAAHTMSMTMCTVPNVSDFTPHARTLAKTTQTQRTTRASPTVICVVDSLVPTVRLTSYRSTATRARTNGEHHHAPGCSPAGTTRTTHERHRGSPGTRARPARLRATKGAIYPVRAVRAPPAPPSRPL